jgi:UDP-N-acetylenolpyruvoylglucosamine reductase
MSPFCEKTPEEMLALRRAKQPPGRSCWSFFRNPPDIPAGKLIDELGLKWFRVGDMQISPFHGNFFINTWAATWQDVLELARIVKEKALIQRNIQLHEEVRILLPNTLWPQ